MCNINTRRRLNTQTGWYTPHTIGNNTKISQDIATYDRDRLAHQEKKMV